MDFGKNCPHCDKDIGVWPVFSASLPNRIWCPHCSARLRYRELGGLIAWQVVLATVIAGTAGVALFVFDVGHFSRNDGFDFTIRVIVFCIGTLAAWVPVELVSTHFLRNNRVLECIAKPKSQSVTMPVSCPMCGATIQSGTQVCLSCGEHRTGSPRL